MEDITRKDQCQAEIAETEHDRSEIPGIVDELVRSCKTGDCFEHISPEPIPSREAVVGLLEQMRRILYPGYFIRSRVDHVNLPYYLGQEATGLFEALSEQISLSIRHECLRHNQPCSQCKERGEKEAIRFMRRLPNLRNMLAMDIRAGYEGDPAAQGLDEIIFSYPGVLAVTVYRIAHELYKQSIPLMPRIMTEYAHGRTGIDIHPGAEIGESFFIDHGTGVVIGETCNIGNRVRIYQGVTLGALSLQKKEVEILRSKKRHPTIGDDVVIYAGATILGGSTVIGARSVIGGNVWITESIPPDTSVYMQKSDLILKGKPVSG